MAPRPVPRWLSSGSLALALVGLLASAYLTYEHFAASATLVCPATKTVDCVKVTESTYASLLGVPVAVLGLAFFLAVTVLCLPGAWRRPGLDGPRVALLGVGTLFVLYLVWAEVFGVGAICLWCTAVHVVTIVLLGLVLFGWALAPRR